MTQCVAYLILTKSFVLISAIQKMIQLGSQITSTVFVAKTVFVKYEVLSAVLYVNVNIWLLFPSALVKQFYFNYNSLITSISFQIAFEKQLKKISVALKLLKIESSCTSRRTLLYTFMHLETGESML